MSYFVGGLRRKVPPNDPFINNSYRLNNFGLYWKRKKDFREDVQGKRK